MIMTRRVVSMMAGRPAPGQGREYTALLDSSHAVGASAHMVWLNMKRLVVSMGPRSRVFPGSLKPPAILAQAGLEPGSVPKLAAWGVPRSLRTVRFRSLRSAPLPSSIVLSSSRRRPVGGAAAAGPQAAAVFSSIPARNAGGLETQVPCPNPDSAPNRNGMAVAWGYWAWLGLRSFQHFFV